MPTFTVRVPVKVTCQDGAVCPARYIGADVEAEDAATAAKMVGAALENLVRGAKKESKAK